MVVPSICCHGLAQLLARRRHVRAGCGHRIACVGRALRPKWPPSAIKLPRRCKSSSAVRAACSRCSICARNSWPCANSPRTWRTARARSASAFSSAIFASAGSSRSSGWPASTSCVSSTLSERHRAGDFAGHLHDIAIHVAIIGCFQNTGRRGTNSRHRAGRPTGPLILSQIIPNAARARGAARGGRRRRRGRRGGRCRSLVRVFRVHGVTRVKT